MAGQLLAEAGTPAQCSEWLPKISSGEKTLALAHAEPGARYALSTVSTTGCRTDGGWSISGSKSLVLDGERADAFLVAVRTAGNDGDANGVTLLLVDAKAPGLTIERFATLDARNAADLRLHNVTVPADAVVGAVGGALPLLDKAIDRATAMLCAEAAGAIEALIDMTAEHLKTRKQFGAPLAKFQVLQHRIADMLIAAEQVKSMACAAAMAIDGADEALRRRLVSAAKVVCGQAGRQVGQAAIQLHGAMGMTDESRVGHYAKRLLVIQQLFGDASHHLQRLTPTDSMESA
jgi:alkylation response protein AidB-like acyl-CoA dehydrogenase